MGVMKQSGLEIMDNKIQTRLSMVEADAQPYRAQ